MRIGKVKENILKRSILKPIGRLNKGAADYTDCACVMVGENKDKTYVLSSTQTMALDFAHNGKYAAIKAVNNIYASGGDVKSILVSMTLPESTVEADIKFIMNEIKEIADEIGAGIDNGHTQVSKYVTAPIITITAIGQICPFAKEFLKISKGKTKILDFAKPGDAIIMTKWIGLEGTSILAFSKEKEILNKYPRFIVDAGKSFADTKYLLIKDDARIAYKANASIVKDVSEGGILGALWEFSQMTHLGLKVDLKSIPIRQESIEITDMLGVNPYQMMSQGSLLLATSNPLDMIDAFEKELIPAVVIGYLTDDNDKIIINGDEIRYLDMPLEDSIHSVL